MQLCFETNLRVTNNRVEEILADHQQQLSLGQKNVNCENARKESPVNKLLQLLFSDLFKVTRPSGSGDAGNI